MSYRTEVLGKTPAASGGMDSPAPRNPWSPAKWPIAAQLGGAGLAGLIVIFVAARLIVGSGVKTLRIPRAQVTASVVEQGIFHDLIPLRAQVEPRETLYIDAIDGGRIDHVLVEPGDHVQQGQPLIELSNTNLALSVIQQESQLNQAMSQLQQNEIALEQNDLANNRALAEIDYNLVKLERSAVRREGLLASGAASREQRDEVVDELTYYRRLHPIQEASSNRQADMRARLLPDIQRQLQNLRANLDVVQGKLAALIIRAPVAGVVTAINLKVGELRNPGERLAEVTPETGMKLVADVDEFYLTRVRSGQSAVMDVDGLQIKAIVRRVSPQVKNGEFSIDLDFDGPSPPNLVSGATAQGRLQLGGDTPARIVPVGPFLDRTGGNWIFVLAGDGRSAQRRQIRLGRRTSEQLEVLSGLRDGERVLTSDYTSLDRADRIVLND